MLSSFGEVAEFIRVVKKVFFCSSTEGPTLCEILNEKRAVKKCIKENLEIFNRRCTRCMNTNKHLYTQRRLEALNSYVYQKYRKFDLLCISSKEQFPKILKVIIPDGVFPTVIEVLIYTFVFN